jgi:hypothetical protein
MLSITWVTGARCRRRRRAGRDDAAGRRRSARRAAEAGDLVDADAVDLLRRLHHLGDDLRQPVEPVLLELQVHQLAGARVLGRDHGPRALGFGGQADALRLGARRRRRRLGLRGHQQHRGLALRLRGLDLAALLLALERDLARAVGDGALALGLQLLLGEHDLGAGELGLRLRARLLGVLGASAIELSIFLTSEASCASISSLAQRARLLDLGHARSTARARCARSPRRPSTARGRARCRRRSPP